MTSNKLRVGILTHNYPRNSKERKDAGIFILDFANELSKFVDVFVLCPDFGGKKEKYNKVPVTWFSWDRGNEKFGDWKLINPKYVFKFFKLIFIGRRETVKFVHDNNIDYVLACWSLPSSIFAYLAKLKTRTRYASWSLGSDVNKYVKIPILSQFIRLALKNADVRFANSYALIERVKEISREKCYFLPAITNFKIQTKQRLIKDNKFHFLYVGRLESVKGVDILMKAIEVLSQKYNNFVVDILGDGSMGTLLKEMSEKIGGNRVIFHGWADEKQVSFFMSGASCLVIPSRNESLPLVMIEAAKKKLPVVATKVGDCERIIRKYNIGVSVEKENHLKLAEGMESVLKGGKRFSSKGFENLSRDFSQSAAVEIFLEKIQ